MGDFLLRCDWNTVMEGDRRLYELTAELMIPDPERLHAGENGYTRLSVRLRRDQPTPIPPAEMEQWILSRLSSAIRTMAGEIPGGAH